MVPSQYAAEMAPFDPMMGEFRVHYAGFFDPGFGVIDGKPKGAKAVLEVRSLDIPFILEDGQTIGRLLVRAPRRYPRGPLRPGAGLQLPGPGPQALQALQVAGPTAFGALPRTAPPCPTRLARSARVPAARAALLGCSNVSSVAQVAGRILRTADCVPPARSRVPRHARIERRSDRAKAESRP